MACASASSPPTCSARSRPDLVDDYDLPLAWFEMLAALQAAGGSMRVGELCEALHELPSSLSRRLDRLEEEGFVSRAATPTADDQPRGHGAH